MKQILIGMTCILISVFLMLINKLEWVSGVLFGIGVALELWAVYTLIRTKKTIQ